MFLLLIGLFKISDSFVYNPSNYAPSYYEFIEAQERLKSDLFANYDPTIAPIYTKINYSLPIGYDKNAPDRFNYTILLYYLKLVEVLEPEEKVSVVLEVMEYWYDLRLAWDASNYSDITEIYVRQSEVWSPTFSAFGVNEIVDFRDQDFRMVGITSRGDVYTYLSVKISANCAMDVRKFPFDVQKCQIRLCLPIFYQKAVKIMNQVYEGILTENMIATMGNSEWVIKKLEARVDPLKYEDDFGSMDLSVFEITMHRSPMYYMYMMVFPSFIINLVSIIGTFMKEADSMTRLNIGLTNIMTMTFLLGVMADKIPKTETIPLLGIFIIINLGIMVIAIGINVFLPQCRKWCKPKLKASNSWLSKKTEKFIGTPLDYTCSVILVAATIANFVFMISYWVDY